MKQYQIIYADPPWSYDDKMSGQSFSLDHEYVTQSKDWIAELEVKHLAAPDSVLFMWAVNPLLPEAFEVIKKWGFDYKTVVFCWVKETKNGKAVSNLGRWTMGGAELCLLATKGSPQRKVLNIKQLVFAERTAHSKKPDEVRDRIVELMGDVPRIELFARQTAPGWRSLGNEIDGKDIKESIDNILYFE